MSGTLENTNVPLFDHYSFHPDHLASTLNFLGLTRDQVSVQPTRDPLVELRGTPELRDQLQLQTEARAAKAKLERAARGEHYGIKPREGWAATKVELVSTVQRAQAKLPSPLLRAIGLQPAPS